MKSATFLPLLLSLLTATTTAQEFSDTFTLSDGFTHSDVSNLLEWSDVMEKKLPRCARDCLSETVDEKWLPPCAAEAFEQSDYDSENEEEAHAWYRKTYTCLCNDRIYNRQQMACIAANCEGYAINEGFKAALANQYMFCALYSDDAWPKPGVVLKEMCLDDRLVGDGINKDKVELLATAPHDLLKNYEYADSWPEVDYDGDRKDTREQLPCQAGGGDDKDEEEEEDEDDEKPSGSPTRSGGAPQETEDAGEDGDDAPDGDDQQGNDADDDDDDEGAAVRYGAGVKVVMAVAGLVGGLAGLF